MRPGATALAVLVAPLIALPLAVVVGGAADTFASGDRPDLIGLLLLGADAVTRGYLPAILVTALLLVPLSRALHAAGVVGAFSYGLGGALTAVPLLLILPFVERLLDESLLGGYVAPVFWATALGVGCVASWLSFWVVARPDLASDHA
ncbi:hypothetical protein [Caulobacter sp. 17J80-11]|uniref:hypothetical protein n=1 Tax=Caulobacter sp. 17J80-11 TaxID=2763502 RepID=UPI001653A73F|nr:hypothetical protein [Caulobacter sp. 17J80-11]MBC6982015.1 hypothetical protein [Caulobacter sp. 17J80-11]